MKKLPFVNSFTSEVPQTKNKSLFLSSQIQIWAVEGECNVLGSGIFLGLILGRITALPQFKNEQKIPKMVYIIPNFPVLQFGKNFTKIQTKIAVKMDENLHKYVNENMFSFTFYANFHEFLLYMKGN